MLRIPLMMGIVFFHFSQHGAAQNVDELLTDEITNVEQTPGTRRQLHDRAGGIVNPIFDLQGRQIGSSLKNGIYIQNGRKVVRK